MKIIIINPPAFGKKDYIREGRCMQTKSSWAALWMPLSLAYIAAAVREKGHTVKLIDCIAEKMGKERLSEIVKEFQPELVVMNTAIPSVIGDNETLEFIKKDVPEIRGVIIGMYPTLFAQEALRKFKSADFAVVNEPEWVIVNLALAISTGDDLEKVRGLIFRKGEDIIIGVPQDLAENDLEKLPFPARDLLNNEAYRLPTNGKKFTLLSIARGCPGRCIYCTANIYYGKKFRHRSVESVVREIEECVSKYDIESFLFWGESFTADPVYGEKICDAIIAKKLKITWSTTSRVDTLNQVLLDKMKQAGCILLGLGIESYNQEILNNIEKGTTLEKIDQAVSMVKKAGISSMGHFIFGLPGDTRETAKRTLKFACRNLDMAQFYCAIPYPKTKLGELAEKNHWVEGDDYTQLDLTKSVMRNEKLTVQEIETLRDQAYRKFYFRPKTALFFLKEVASLKHFFSALNFFNWIKVKRKK